MEIPSNWIHVELQGIDSHVGDIKMGQQQMASFDLGWYSNPLNEDSTTHTFETTIIDGNNAKIVKPKISGKGLTGVFFPSINGSRNQFQISGKNLNQANEKLFLTAIQSIRFTQ